MKPLSLHKIYADGAFQRGRAAWAYTARCGDVVVHEASGLVCLDPFDDAYIGAEAHTNNTAELSAIYWAMFHAALAKLFPVVIYSDSQYAVGAVKGECHAAKNKELVRQVRHLYLGLAGKCSLRWVKGHDGNPGNEQADKLANERLSRG